MQKLSRTLLVKIAAGVLILAAILAAAWMMRPEQPSAEVSQIPTLPNDYQDEAKAAVREFERLAETPDGAAATSLKERLLERRISGEDKALHLKLVMAKTALEEYAVGNDTGSLAYGRQLISEIKRDYPWIN